ncbi:MAG: STAS/SEC14 domain-containing protein [Myxococcales bacterium]|nr:STAS/SEC14 domain-containing protein [Myxococcales bacterium]
MRHEVSWDDAHGCVRLTLRGPFLLDDARVMLDAIDRALVGRPRRYLLIDHTESPGALPPETRRYIQSSGQQMERIAFFGMSNLTRVAARVIVAVIGQSGHTGIFKSEAEALAWLGKPGATDESIGRG